MWILQCFICVLLTAGKLVKADESARSCFGGVATYEKTHGGFFNVSPSHELSGHGKHAVTPDCAALCSQSDNCVSFTIDYKSGKCQAFDRDSIGRRDLLIPSGGVNYLEQVCYRGVNHYNDICGNRIWAFERIIGAFLEGFDDKVERNVNNKVDCEKLCLAQSFCRSAEYDELKQICRLSREDRKTQPSAFKYSPGSSIDYLENQCFKPGSDCEFKMVTTASLQSLDDLQYTSSAIDCQKMCVQTLLFTCWAFAYDNSQSRCYLSGETVAFVSDGSLIAVHPGVTFGERKCISNHCSNGSVTFEKVTAHTVRTSVLEPLSVNRVGQGVTLDCLQQCESLDMQCSALIVDYVNNKCFRVNRGSHEQEDITSFRSNSYFEKTCLKGIRHRCREKAWTFERVMKHELSGFDSKIIPVVQSRFECEELCLSEVTFECRSAEYDYSAVECRLSAYDRRDKPHAFRPTKENVDYLENECATNLFESEVVKKDYVSPTFVEAIQSQVKDVNECKSTCADYQKFVCRTAGYRPQSGECLLSSDDVSSVSSIFAENHPETILIERKFEIAKSHKVPLPLPTVPVGYPDLTQLWNAFSKSIFAASTKLPPTVTEKEMQQPVTPIPRPSVYIGGRCQLTKVGFTEYEKVTGYTLNAALTPVQLSSAKDDPELVQRCKDFCDLNRNCLSFNVNYKTGQCGSLIRDSSSGLSDFQVSEGAGYFEPTCFQSLGCGRLWTFERHLNKTLLGHARATYKGISKAECQERCLFENEFSCNSVSYHYSEMECRLSSEDRFTKPFAFANSPGTDYLENQCSRNLTMRQRFPCQYTPVMTDRILSYADKTINTKNESECEKACEVELQFVCRSYSFIALHLQNLLQAPDCRLSADTRASEGAELLEYRSAIYVERNCLSEISETTVTVLENRGDSKTDVNSSPTPVTSRTTEYDDWNQGFSSSTSLDSTDSFPNVTTSTAMLTEQTTTTYDTTKESAVSEKPLDPVQRSHGTSTSSDSGELKCNYGTRFIYERTMGFNIHQTPRSLSTVLVSSTSKDTVADCFRACTLKAAQCTSLIVHYPVSSSYTTCVAFNESSYKERLQLVPKSGTAYFEKICLKTSRGCEKQWTFERVIGFYLNDTYGRDLHLQSKEDCEENCLTDTATPCRSASYIYSRQLCRMSPETRRTRPESFHYAGNDVDYLENQCAPETSTGEYVQEQDKFNPFINKILFGVYTVEECQISCDTEKQFLCRSVSYDVPKRICYLSAEDKFSTPTGQNNIRQLGTIYAEKSGYSQMKVVCSRTEMIVTLKFDEPFDGILYAKGNPIQCFFPGNSQTRVTISIPFGTRCGTIEESPGRYRNDVVVQQHPVIMTTSDKIFRIICSSSVTDKTVKIPTRGRTSVNVAYSTQLLAVPPTLLSSAAITPNVKMRITDPNGRDVNSVNIGDPLVFRIEPSPFSAFGIFAKNLVARSEFLEFIVLLDNNGCATDTYVFPTLIVEKSTKALVGQFSAFRFPSTGLIYFEVEIQFCRYLCPLPDCSINATRNRHKQRDLFNKKPLEDHASKFNSPLVSYQADEIYKTFKGTYTQLNTSDVEQLIKSQRNKTFNIYETELLSLPLRKSLKVI